VDVHSAMEKLDNQIENVDKRAKVLENKVNSLKQDALAKRKAKDNRGIQRILIIIFIGALHSMK